MASRSLALSQANLIHIYSSHFIIGKVTSSVEDLWRNVDPHFHKLPPIFCSLCFSPIHPDVYLGVCKIMKNSVFSVFSSSTPRSPTALSPHTYLHLCRLIAHAVSSLAFSFALFFSLLTLSLPFLSQVTFFHFLLIYITQNTSWQGYWECEGAMATRAVRREEGFKHLTKWIFKMNAGARADTRS